MYITKTYTIMTLNEFKIKHKHLIDLGIIRFTNENPIYKHIVEEVKVGKFSSDILSFASSYLCEGDDMIIIDRFSSDLQTILCEAKEIAPVRRDVLNMGYEKGIGMGVYIKI